MLYPPVRHPKTARVAEVMVGSSTLRRSKFTPHNLGTFLHAFFVQKKFFKNVFTSLSNNLSNNLSNKVPKMCSSSIFTTQPVGSIIQGTDPRRRSPPASRPPAGTKRWPRGRSSAPLWEGPPRAVPGGQGGVMWEDHKW